ncbi:hypothetical protein ACOMHN_004459 [Nucella lapillus]
MSLVFKDMFFSFNVAVVTPIIDQARQSLGQVTGDEPVGDDLTGFSVQHTHKEYQYKDDGTAVVQSDVYKKSYNWSSEEGQSQGTGAEAQDVKDGTQLTSEDEDKTVTPGEGEEGNIFQNTDSGRVHWNPETPETQGTERPTAQDGQEGGTAAADEPKEEEGRPQGGEAQLVAADSSNNKTNNYLSSWRERQSATARWLKESCGFVSHDRDWANHCSHSSPSGALTPRHSTSASSPDDLLLPQGDDMSLVPLVDSWLPVSQQRTAEDLGWERGLLSQGSSWQQAPWSSQTSQPPVSTTKRWCPSPRLDYFPVNSHSDTESMWLTPAHPSQVSRKSLLGEVAFQLERRILDYVFADSLPDLSPGAFSSPEGRGGAAQRWRMRGYTVSNIGEMINQEALAGSNYSRGTERMLRERLRTMLDLLTPMGYDLMEHGAFSQDIINKYGLLSTPPAEVSSKSTGQVSETGISDTSVADVQNFIFTAAESDEERDTLLLVLDCLRMLAIEDGRPLFV